MSGPAVEHTSTPLPVLTLRASRKQSLHKHLPEMWEVPLCVGDGNCVAIVCGGGSGGTYSDRESVVVFAAKLRDAYNSHASHLLALAKAREALQDLIRAYVSTLESARDVIIGLGGDCDPVDMMERADPRLAKAKAALLSLPPQTVTK